MQVSEKAHSSEKLNIQMRENGKLSGSVHTLFKASPNFFIQLLVQITPSKVPVFAKERFIAAFLSGV